MEIKVVRLHKHVSNCLLGGLHNDLSIGLMLLLVINKLSFEFYFSLSSLADFLHALGDLFLVALFLST
jgi:hypothetical protein